MTTKRIALIDGDEQLYRIGFACQKPYYHVWQESSDSEETRNFQTKKDAIEFIGSSDGDFLIVPCKVVTCSEKIAVSRLRYAIKEIVRVTRAADYKVYLTGDCVFRHDIATIQPYKGNRDGGRPIYYNDLKDTIVREFGAIEEFGIEADDAMSIKSYEYAAEGWAPIVCCQDKDLDMVPGLHYNPTKKVAYTISRDDAWKNFYKQLLMGDNTDNIPGIHGIGPKTAAKRIDPCKSEIAAYNVVLDAYIRAKEYRGMNIVKVIHEIGNLLWMLRSRDDEWHPPKPRRPVDVRKVKQG